MTSPLEAATSLRDSLAAAAQAARLAATEAGAAAGRAAALADQASALVVLLEQGSQPDPGPEPTDDFPAGVNAVRIGDATYPLAAVNPTRTDYQGGRGPDELVLYRRPVEHTTTNLFGTEVTVMGGLVVEPLDREAARQTAGVAVPRLGYVLSGHRRARQWLNTHAVRGARVELVRLDQPLPAPVPDPAPRPSGRRTVAIYRKDGSSSVTRIPPGVNQFRYAFFQRNRLVEWGGESIDVQAAGLGRWLDGAPGREVLISVGGAKGVVSTANRGAFLGGFLEAEKQLGGRVTGIDWDLEASALVVDDVVAISRALADGRKDSYVISFAPPGGAPVAPALQAAVQLQREGYRVEFGQQLYEAPGDIPLPEAMKALRRAVSAGLPPSCVLLGTMVGSDVRHWTIDECVQVLRAALTEWPDFGGAYLWSEGQEAQDAEWARRMAEILG